MTTVSARPDPAIPFDASDGGDGLLLDVVVEPDRRVVSLTGDLDLATRHLLFLVATTGGEANVVIDLTGVRFMDCAGYGGIVAASNVLEADGRHMTLRGQQGEPGRLLALIRSIEADGAGPDRRAGS